VFFLYLFMALFGMILNFGEIFQKFHSTSHPAGWEFKHEKSRVCSDRLANQNAFYSILGFACVNGYSFPGHMHMERLFKYDMNWN